MSGILHIVPGVKELNSGITVAVRLMSTSKDSICDAREVNAYLRGCEAQEVWVHSVWLPSVWKACLLAKKYGKHLVRMPHGNLDPVRLKYHWLRKWLVGPIERYFLRKADKIVATCDAEKEWIEAYLGKKCPEIVVEDVKRFFDFSRKERIGRVEERENSVSRVERVEGDESVFNAEAQRRRGAENDELHLLYLGRRHPLKGVEYLESAVKEISTRSTRSTRLKIELKIVSNAFGEELEKVWEWCDVLVLPTLSENFGLVVAEALERGKRVITTDGAPVWGEGLGVRGDGCEIGVGCGGRLLYLKGYMDGSDEERVELLKRGILAAKV